MHEIVVGMCECDQREFEEFKRHFTTHPEGCRKLCVDLNGYWSYLKSRSQTKTNHYMIDAGSFTPSYQIWQFWVDSTVSLEDEACG